MQQNPMAGPNLMSWLRKPTKNPLNSQIPFGLLMVSSLAQIVTVPMILRHLQRDMDTGPEELLRRRHHHHHHQMGSILLEWQQSPKNSKPSHRNRTMHPQTIPKTHNSKLRIGDLNYDPFRSTQSCSKRNRHHESSQSYCATIFNIFIIIIVSQKQQEPKNSKLFAA